MKTKIFKLYILTIIILLFGNNIYSQTCTCDGNSLTASITASGDLCSMTIKQFTINCAPAGATVTSATLTVSSTNSDCSYYGTTYDISIAGSVYMDQCPGVYNINTQIAGRIVNGLTFAIEPWVYSYFCSSGTVTLSVTITFTGGTCSGGGTPSGIISTSTSIPLNTLIGDSLIPSCGSSAVSNIQASGNCYGYFDYNNTAFPFKSGIVLTTGSVNTVANPATVESSGNVCSASGSTYTQALAMLASTAGVTTSSLYNASIIQFNFVPQTPTVSFNYIFASEEFSCYCNTSSSDYNDVFGFFLTGPGITGSVAGYANTVNIARLPNNNAVTIRNLCLSSGSQYKIGPYVNSCPEKCTSGSICYDWYYGNICCNSSAILYYGATVYDGPYGNSIVFDAATQKLTATQAVTPGQTYTIRLAIADVGDYLLDSGVFLEMGSFVIAPPTIAANPNTTVLSCDNPSLVLTANSSTGTGTYSWSTGAATQNITVTTPGVYTVTVSNSSCTTSGSVTITEDKTPPTAGITKSPDVSTITCANSTMTLTATPASMQYDWGSGFSTTATKVINSPGTYWVTVKNPSNGCTNSTSVTIAQDGTAPTVTISPTTGTLTCTTTSITVTASGTGNSYSWSGGSTPSAATNTLTTAGTYYVTATNTSNGCTANTSIVISSNTTPPTANVTPDSDELRCDVESVSATASGGGTYSWSGGTSPSTATNSFTAPGTYTVTVTSATNGCTAFASTNITSIDVNIDTINNSGTTVLGCNSQIHLTATEPNGIIYKWPGSDSGSDPNIYISEPGNYTVTVTTSYGCTETATVTITEDKSLPDVDIVNLTGTTVLSCTTTSILVVASGGVTGDTYTWSGGETPSSAPNKFTSPGTYTVTITKISNGCSDTASIEITQDDDIPNVTITPSSGTLTCTTTSIDVTASGGETYLWSGGLGSSANATITSAGTYTVTVTGANACTNSKSITIGSDKTDPVADISPDSGTLTCAEANIQLTASGGGNYAWSNGATTNQTTVTSEGIYTVTVTDTSNGCTASKSVTITQDEDLPVATITPSSGTLTCTTTSISVTASGGNTYSWSGGLGQNANATITSAGTYTVTVTNTSNGCSATANIIIAEDVDKPIVDIDPDSGTLTCTTTSISVTASGGDTYSWSGGETPANATNTFISTGTFTVTVTNTSNGCTNSESITILPDGEMPYAIITPSSGIITCTTTSISVTASGGDSYAWSHGLGTDATVVLSTADTYTVTVTNTANGCTNSQTITIDSNTTPPSANISPSSGTLTCLEPNIQVTASGGGTYLWSDGLGTNTTVTITTAGTYYVTVTGANGCTNVASIEIDQDGDLPIANITPNTATITCTNPNIALTASGDGNYLWSTGSTSSQITVTSGGTYTVTVTNTSNGCSATANATIAQDDTQPQASISPNSGELTCSVTSIPVEANGGGNYSWSGGLGNLAEATITTTGTYTVTVTNPLNGCTNSASIFVTSNTTPPSASINPSSGELTCSNPNILVTASGGGTYSWSNQSTNQQITVTTAGTYTVTVTGTNDCTASASIAITSNTTAPTNTQINSTGTVITCQNTSQTLTANGGTSYQWSNGSTNQQINVTNAGTYYVTVTGANGCTVVEDITITQNTPNPTALITNNTNATTLTCSTQSINVTASGGNTYQWNDGSTTTNINITTGGTYSVTVTNTEGCTNSTSITIYEDKAQPQVAISTSPNTTEFSCSVQTIDLIASGGISYAWNTGNNSTTISVTNPGTYSVTATGTNGCTNTANISITQGNSEGITVYINVVEALKCYGYTNGVIEAVAVSGTGNLTYQWNNGASANIISGLAAGNYSVTVTDNNGCYGIANVQMQTPAQLNLTTDVTGIRCYGESNGRIVADVSGGTPPYQYNWNTGNAGNIRTNLIAGNYSITVVDNNGCSINKTTNITVPSELNLNYTTQNASCFGVANGRIFMTASGGSLPYTYNIYSNGSYIPEAMFSQLPAGLYNIRVEDRNGCIKTFDTQITEPELIEISYQIIDPSCRGNNDGNITLRVNGGIDPYLYYINDYKNSEPIFQNLTAGEYQITIIDANGCKQVVDGVGLSDDHGDCIRIPNAITIDDNGINDTWIIENIGLFPKAQVYVFNRWGQEVYKGKYDEKPWNGTFKGKKVPTGQYIYVINLFDGSKPYSGVVSVIY